MIGLRFRLLMLLLLAVAASPGPAQAEDYAPVAQKLIETTVTVRISTREDQANDEQNSVVVCSGVSLGKGLLVTYCGDVEPDRFRITLPDGEQAEAEPRVIDRYSGLGLLEISHRSLPALELAEAPPAVGKAVLTAAAAGIEKPAVSLGILGGIDRSLSGVELPPLLQCDVRTTETSGGAAVVDGTGKLIGIVVATGAPQAQAGWTYAIPVRHVRRLIEAQMDEQMVELQRRRPVVGFTVGPGKTEGSVVVERLEPGGPAEQAGLQQGDLVIECDGRRIRSAYQAVDQILKKLPGETMQFVVEQEGELKQVDLVLAGAPVQRLKKVRRLDQNAAGLQAAQLNVASRGRNNIEIRGGLQVQELNFEDGDWFQRQSGAEVERLKQQLSVFEQLIERLQKELSERHQQQAETDKLVQALQREVKELKDQQEPSGAAGSGLRKASR